MADRCRVTDDGLSRRQRPLFSAVTRVQELKKHPVECHCRHAETLKEADPGVFVANAAMAATIVMLSIRCCGLLMVFIPLGGRAAGGGDLVLA